MNKMGLGTYFGENHHTGRENSTRILVQHEFCISKNQFQRRKTKQVAFGETGPLTLDVGIPRCSVTVVSGGKGAPASRRAHSGYNVTEMQIRRGKRAEKGCIVFTRYTHKSTCLSTSDISSSFLDGEVDGIPLAVVEYEIQRYIVYCLSI